jgi:hypothetical protein
MDEPEKCPWCKNGLYDPPKRKCDEPDFHWKLAGREWTVNEEGQWVATETAAHREGSFDGLLVTSEKSKAKLRVYMAEVVDGQIRVTGSKLIEQEGL